MPEDKFSPRRGKRWLRIFLILSLLLALLALFFTYGLRYGAVKWLESRGADSARIGWLHINPLTGFMTIEDMEVRKDGEVVLYDQDIDIDISLRDLFRRQLTIEYLSLSGVNIDIRQYADGRLRLAGLSVGTGDDGPAADEPEEDSGDPWLFNVASLRLKDCRISFSSPGDTFTLRVEDLGLSHFSTGRLYEKGVSILFRGRFNEAPLRLQIEDSNFLSQPAAVSGRIGFSDLDLAGFSSITPGFLDNLEGRLSAAGDFSLDMNSINRLGVSYDGNFTLKDTRLAAGGHDLVSRELSWLGGLEYDKPGDSSSLSLDGDLRGSALDLEMRQPDLLLKQKGIDLSTKSELRFDGGSVAVDGDTALELEGTELSLEENKLIISELGWQGKTDYKISDQQTGSIVGILEGKDLVMDLVNQELELKLASLSLDTGTSLTGGDKALKISGNNDLKLSGTTLNLGGDRPFKGSMEELRLKECRLDSLDDITADQLRMADLTFTIENSQDGENDPVLSLGDGKIENISYLSGEAFTMENVDLVDLYSHIRREEDGGLNVARALSSQDGEPGKDKGEIKKTGQAQSSSPGKIDLGLNRLRVSGESGLKFEDYSTAEPFQAVLDIENLELTDLNSAEPEKPLNFLLQGSLGRHSDLDVNGTCTPFAEELSLTLNTSLRDYPASGLSSYTVDSIGYYLSQGQVNIDSHLELTGNDLDSENSFLFKKLEVDVAREEVAEKMTGMLQNISLDQALSLLRDDKEHISLDIPVSGPLDDLQVSFNSIARKVVSSAVMRGAESYFMVALGPYGALASVGYKLGGYLLKVRLPPVIFPSGESELRAVQEDYLRKLASILYERPELEVIITGVAVPAERGAVLPEAAEENGAARPE
ncbi:MAG: DUF748 domain-containing protein, partial [Desulfobia sp.]